MTNEKSPWPDSEATLVVAGPSTGPPGVDDHALLRVTEKPEEYVVEMVGRGPTIPEMLRNAAEAVEDGESEVLYEGDDR